MLVGTALQPITPGLIVIDIEVDPTLVPPLITESETESVIA